MNECSVTKFFQTIESTDRRLQRFQPDTGRLRIQNMITTSNVKLIHVLILVIKTAYHDKKLNAAYQIIIIILLLINKIIKQINN